MERERDRDGGRKEERNEDRDEDREKERDGDREGQRVSQKWRKRHPSITSFNRIPNMEGEAQHFQSKLLDLLGVLPSRTERGNLCFYT